MLLPDDKDHLDLDEGVTDGPALADRRIQHAVNTCLLCVLRWEKNVDMREKRAARLGEFAEAWLEDVDALAVNEKGKALLSPSELTLVLLIMASRVVRERVVATASPLSHAASFTLPHGGE